MIILLPLADFRQQYENALQTLASYGVKVSGTRLARYRTILRTAETQEACRIESHQGDLTFLNALVESAEVIKIAELDGQWFTADEVVRKLGKISHGPEVMAPEGFDHGRDCAFEFSTAAVLQTQGRFGGFSELGGDLTISAERSPAECKRISSLRCLEKRLREGRQQLDELVLAGSPPGVIAIDLTRPMRLALGPIVAADNDQLIEESQQRLAAYLERHVLREKHHKALAASSTLGILVRYVAVGIAGDLANVRTSTIWQACSLHPDTSEENRIFENLAVGFGPGPLRSGTREELIAAAERFAS